MQLHAARDRVCDSSDQRSGARCALVAISMPHADLRVRVGACEIVRPCVRENGGSEHAVAKAMARQRTSDLQAAQPCS